MSVKTAFKKPSKAVSSAFGCAEVTSGSRCCVPPAQEHVKREKQIMAECDCLFMVNLVTSFKDETHLYLLLECVMGGELFTYLQVSVCILAVRALIFAHRQPS